jgi:hypothetical protein
MSNSDAEVLVSSPEATEEGGAGARLPEVAASGGLSNGMRRIQLDEEFSRAVGDDEELRKEGHLAVQREVKPGVLVAVRCVGCNDEILTRHLAKAVICPCGGLMAHNRCFHSSEGVKGSIAKAHGFVKADGGTNLRAAGIKAVLANFNPITRPGGAHQVGYASGTEL